MPPAKLDPVGSREALAAVDAVRARAGTVPGATTPWALLLPTGVLVGVSIFFAMMESLWGIAAMVLACVLCLFGAARYRDRRSRLAVKQPVVHQDPPGNLWFFVPLFAAQTLMIFAPKGNPVIAATAGVIAGTLFVLLIRKMDKQ